MSALVPLFPPLNSQPSSLVNTYLFHTIILTEKTPKERKEKEKKTQGKNGGWKINFAIPFFLSLVQSTDRSQTPKTQLVPKVGAWDGQGAHKTNQRRLSGRSEICPCSPSHYPPSCPSPHLVGPLQPGLLGKPLREALPLPALTPTLETAVTFSQRL